MDSPSQQGCLLRLPPPVGVPTGLPPRAERLFKSRLRAPEKEATAWDLYCTRGAVTWAMGVPQLGCRLDGALKADSTPLVAGLTWSQGGRQGKHKGKRTVSSKACPCFRGLAASFHVTLLSFLVPGMERCHLEAAQEVSWGDILVSVLLKQMALPRLHTLGAG